VKKKSRTPLKLLAPANYRAEKAKNKKFMSESYTIMFYAREFVPGDAFYLELLRRKSAPDQIKPQVLISDKELQLTSTDWGYRAMFAIHPENKENPLTLEIIDYSFGKKTRQSFSLELTPKEFPVSTSAMNVGRFSRTDLAADKEIQKRVSQEIQLKAELFRKDTPDKLNAQLSHPRNFHSLTSPFYIKRIYEQYEIRKGVKINREPIVSYHTGLDFMAKTGDPVYSMASGTVVLAQSLYYEGNCVIVDHGSRIFSIFMHLDTLNVNKNDLVEAGQLIGNAGSTGVSTGAHLHVSLYVRGTPADPLSFLYLPIRD